MPTVSTPPRLVHVLSASGLTPTVPAELPEPTDGNCRKWVVDRSSRPDTTADQFHVTHPDYAGTGFRAAARSTTGVLHPTGPVLDEHDNVIDGDPA